jgi:hypothetical protein
MKRRWLWAGAAAVIFLAVGIVSSHGRDGRSEAVRAQHASSPRAHPNDEASGSTSTSEPTDAGGATPSSTTTVHTGTVTGVTEPRAAASTATTARAAKDDPTPTTAAPRWVTVMTVSHDYGDPQRVDSARFDLATGHARIVLDEFHVGDQDANVWWYIMGDDPYHSEAHGNCDGPAAPTQSGSPTTTAHPAVGPTCEAGYEMRFDIQPGNYFLRIDSSHAKWTAKIQELR